MTSTRVRLPALLRWALLLALFGLGLTLVGSAWTNRREAQQLSHVLDRGQAETFFRPIPPLHERNRGPATSADLAAILEQFREQGLRYLAEYDDLGRLVAEAGRHAGSARPTPSGSSSEPRLFGERVRVTFRPPAALREHRGPPPPGPPPNAPRHPQSGPPEPGREPDPRRGPPPEDGAGSARPPRQALPDLVLEFEPTVSRQLRERANRSFIFSITAAISLLALTLGLLFLLAREDQHRVRSERERQLATLGEMSAVLAHEIRNPLASLKGHAQLLGEQLAGDAKVRKKVTRIVDEARRLEELTSTLLDLVRSSSVTRQPTDPALLLREAADSIDEARIVLDTSQAPPSWSLDGPRMAQVLRNLLQNAMQASPLAARVEASVSLERGELVVRVRDYGEGLTAGSETQIFEPFHTSRAKGTGLGLAIARRIVELHGGSIRAENHSQGGALFTLWIPG